ncbi:MAG: DUF3990 domain-containing protein [Treponema sp.]|nr:DUF3990 domain-containing protein [Treponema sp.]
MKEINLKICKPFRDFGKGFYLTNIRSQAESMAKRTSRIKGETPVLNIYEIDDDFIMRQDLRVKDFSSIPTEEWALFVMNNRNRNFSDRQNSLCNQDCKYDIVHGPVADDAMAVLFQQYEQEFIDLEMLKKRMTYKELSMQYSFHTEKAVSLLKKVKVIYG